MLKNRFYLLTVPLVCFVLYDNRKKIYYSYKWCKLWTIVKGISLLKRYGLWWKDVIKLTPDEIFIKQNKDKFLYKLVQHKSLGINVGVGAGVGVGVGVGAGVGLNSNMLDIYYNKPDLTLALSCENKYESIWKTRIIIINTPYGNVGMNYDLYYKGFLYYSDMRNIPYNVLNCISMNYVLKYFCLYFYVDNTMVDDWISPFWIIWYKPTDPQTEQPQTETFIKRLNKPTFEPVNKQVIAKLKNYRLDFGKNDKGEPNIIYNKNRFIYSGKITDMPSFKMKKPVIQVKPKKLTFEEYKKQISPVNHTISFYDKLFR
jgi:hypothetical protein